MWRQTVTLYARGANGDTWTRSVLNGVNLRLADGQTMSAQGLAQVGGSTLMVRGAAGINAGDYVVPGVCPVESFTGNPVKQLNGHNPMRVSGRKSWPVASGMAHTTYTLEGGWA